MTTIVTDVGNQYISYTYTVAGSVITLTGMTFDYLLGRNTVATLPNEVTEIAENFADGLVTPSLQYITELIIGENVTYYKKGICKNWTSLTHLRLNQTIAPTIEWDTYYLNSSYPIIPTPTSFHNSALNTLSIYIDYDVYDIIQYLLGPIVYQIVTLNVIDILNESFSNDSVLITQSNLSRPDRFQIINVTSINILTDTNVLKSSFRGFSNLTSANMPLVTSIYTAAFALCTALTSISMPLVTSIGSQAFYSCPINIQSLQQLYYQGFTSVKTNTDYGFSSATQSQIQPYNITDNTIISIPTPEAGPYYITIPDTITAIAANAATNATYITALTIPSTVTTIGANAFSGCSALTSVVLPPSVLLGTNAFSGTAVSETSLQTMLNQGYTNEQLIAAGFTIVPDTPDTPDTPVTPVPCFNENSKILCLIDGQEKEVLIQNLRSGVLVKTFYSGYKPVCMIGTSVLYNPATDERFNDRLFICKKEKYPELNEDLIITGCHSILVDEITPLQREKIIKQMGAIYETENNYRLNAILDDRAEPYNCSGKFNIYHIALEHDNYYANYGVYANGLLVETCRTDTWLFES
jgi:hypothetical protein